MSVTATSELLSEFTSERAPSGTAFAGTTVLTSEPVRTASLSGVAA